MLGGEDDLVPLAGEQPPLVGFVVLAALTAIMVGWALWLLKRGYKLRA